jgi:hypothetical protein
MSDAERVFQRQLQKLALEEQAATSDYNAHLYNNDEDAAGDAMLQIAQARNQRNVLVAEYQAALRATNTERHTSAMRLGRPVALQRWTSKTSRIS